MFVQDCDSLSWNRSVKELYVIAMEQPILEYMAQALIERKRERMPAPPLRTTAS